MITALLTTTRLFFKTIGLLLLALLLIPPSYYYVLSTNESLIDDIIDKGLHLPSTEPLRFNQDLSSSKVQGYIINLDRSPERLLYVKSSLEQLNIPITKISAVDGKKLSQNQIDSYVDLKSFKKYLGHSPNLGTIGCSLSHIHTWITFLQSSSRYALIMEDDISFDPEALNLLVSTLTEESSELWDIVNLENHHRGHPLALKTFENQQKLCVYLTRVSHTGAYLINREGAKKLLEKALPIKMPVDHYFTRAWEFSLRFTGIENPRVVHQSFGESEIVRTKRVDKFDKNLLERIVKLSYKAQSEAIRLFYNLKVYVTSAREEDLKE